ncbi:MAG: hypothetical protein K8S55_10120, partial [Phycisphaerae bacterium]|nr:hypothetical protein [Phycisphaerae bacterium]
LYRYVNNDPLDYTDPSGLCGEDLAWYDELGQEFYDPALMDTWDNKMKWLAHEEQFGALPYGWSPEEYYMGQQPYVPPPFPNPYGNLVADNRSWAQRTWDDMVAYFQVAWDTDPYVAQEDRLFDSTTARLIHASPLKTAPKWYEQTTEKTTEFMAKRMIEDGVPESVAIVEGTSYAFGCIFGYTTLFDGLSHADIASGQPLSEKEAARRTLFGATQTATSFIMLGSTYAPGMQSFRPNLGMLKGFAAPKGGTFPDELIGTHTKVRITADKTTALLPSKGGTGPLRWQVMSRADGAGGSWPTARAHYWKQRTGSPVAPRHPIVDVPKELHHIDGRNIPNPHDPSNLMEVWPWEHADIDPFRYYNGPRP